MKKALSLLLTMVLVLGLAIPSMAVNTQRSDYEMKLVGTDVKSGGKDSIRLELQAKGAQIAGTQLAAIRYKKDQLVAVRPNGTAVSVTESNSMIGGVANLTTAATDSYEFSTPQAYLKDTGDGYVTVTIMVAVSSGTSTFCSAGLKGLAFITLQLASGVTYDDLNNKSIMWCTSEQAADVSLNAAAAVNDGSVNICYNIDNTETVEFATAPALTYTGSDRTVSTPITDITLSLDKSEVTVDGTNGDTITVTATKTPADATKDVTLSVSGPAGAKGVTLSGTTITVAKDATAGNYTVTAKGDAVTKTATFEVKRAASVATTVTLSPTSGTATLKAAGGADAITVGVTVKDQYGATMNGQTATISGQPAGVTYTGGKLTFDNTARATSGAQNVTFTVGGKTATFALTIKKGTQSAPTTPTAVKTTTVGGSDGKITGVTTAMEYSSNGTTYTACTGTEVTGLTKGTYKVRYAATDYLDASPAKDVSVGEPGKTDTPTVTIASAPAAVSGTVTLAENGSATLTATVTPSTGTIHYQWKKGTANVGTDSNTLTVAAADADTYTCVVTRQGTGETVSDPATSNAITVAVKSKTNVVVAKNATASQNEGALDASKLVTVTDGTWDQVKDAVTAKVYKFVAAVADDPDTADVDESVAAHYEEVTGSLTEGTYYVDVAVAAITDQADYKVDAVAGAGAPNDATAPDDLVGYVKLSVTKVTGGGGGISNTITVRYNAGTNGTLTGSATETVKRGEYPANVPTVTAKDGFRFLGWSQNGKDIVDPTTVKINSGTTFTALYVPVKNTYISGYPDGTFHPDAQVTRAEIASMLARLNKDFDANGTYTGSATDVAADAWYAKFVNFGLQKGFITGHQDGSFAPDASITRGEFASMLARYMGLANGSKQFTDTADHWASGSIAALADAGVITGYTDGSFLPNGKLTRAEAVQMINSALKVSAEGVTYDVVPTDVAAAHWAYTQILTAMNTDIKDIVQ